MEWCSSFEKLSSIGDNEGEKLLATSIVTLLSYVDSSTREKME